MERKPDVDAGLWLRCLTSTSKACGYEGVAWTDTWWLQSDRCDYREMSRQVRLEAGTAAGSTDTFCIQQKAPQFNCALHMEMLFPLNCIKTPVIHSCSFASTSGTILFTFIVFPFIHSSSSCTDLLYLTSPHTRSDSFAILKTYSHFTFF